jgi:predicted AlkP superfamily phosphohydrolase/phosphomutase
LFACEQRENAPVLEFTPTTTSIAAIATQAATEGTVTPTPTLVPEIVNVVEPTGQVSHYPVLLISWDGAPAKLVYEMMQSGELPKFSSLSDRGVRAEYALSVNPSLTTPAQNSISSGSLPSTTGIVGNKFHNPSDSFYWYRSGFTEVMDTAEPIWVTASRAGLSTASIFFPGGSPEHPGQMADFTIGYGIRDAYSHQETVSLVPAQQWENTPISYSPVLEADYQIPQVARLYFLVTDSTDDGIQNYDKVGISTSRRITTSSPILTAGDWGSLVLLENTFSGADFLIQDLTSEHVTFYHTSVYQNTASPRLLLEELNNNFGYFRPGADSYALEHGWITEDDYLYLLKQSAFWMAQVSSWVFSTYKPDLLFTWQDTFDAAGHTFDLVDSRQSGYSDELSGLYRSYYKQAGLISDQALELYLADININDATVILVSDHGMAPVHTNVYVNTVLERAGLLQLDNRNYVLVDQSQALAFPSGGAMHIYINLAGREDAGIVPPDQYLSVRNQIVDLFSNLIDPESGDYVFQRVYTQDDFAALGLDHPNSGDVFAQANPGYNLDGWRGKDEVFAQSEIYGQHGYDPNQTDMWAIFIAAGRGVDRQGDVIAPIDLVDIAPTIAYLLGINPPPDVDGVYISEISNP